MPCPSCSMGSAQWRVASLETLSLSQIVEVKTNQRPLQKNEDIIWIHLTSGVFVIPAKHHWWNSMCFLDESITNSNISQHLPLPSSTSSSSSSSSLSSDLPLALHNRHVVATNNRPINTTKYMIMCIYIMCMHACALSKIEVLTWATRCKSDRLQLTWCKCLSHTRQHKSTT